jgi:hypothetical protein
VTDTDAADPLRLDAATRAKLRAVIFDANTYTSSPDLRNLAANALRLKMVGLETWIPEPVVLEWTEHLISDWRQVSTAARDQRARIRRAGLTAPESPYTSELSIREQFMASLLAVPHLKVIAMTGANALEALRDQILLRPPAKRKGGSDEKPGVKTGASDSSWLRDVIDQAERKMDSILIVTEDRDILRAIQEWGYSPPLMRRRQDLRRSLYEVSLDEDEAASVVHRYLQRQIPNAQMGPGGMVDDLTLDVGNTPSLDTAIQGSENDYMDTRVYGAGLTRLTEFAGMTDVVSSFEDLDPYEVFGEDGDLEASLGAVRGQTITARVFFLADGQATVNRIDNSGDSYVDTIEPTGLLVRAELLFEVVEGQVVLVRPEDDAFVSIGSNRFFTPEDGLAELFDSLSCVPGLAAVAEWAANDNPQRFESRLFESDFTLVIAAGSHDFWSFELQISDETVVVTCEYDPSARVWDGPDSFDYYPPFYISVNGIQVPDSNPEWGVAAWLMGYVGRISPPST